MLLLLLLLLILLGLLITELFPSKFHFPTVIAVLLPVRGATPQSISFNQTTKTPHASRGSPVVMAPLYRYCRLLRQYEGFSHKFEGCDDEKLEV